MGTSELKQERIDSLRDDGDESFSMGDDAQELLETAQLNDQTRKMRVTGAETDSDSNPRKVTFKMRPVFGGPEITKTYDVPRKGSLREVPELKEFLLAFDTDPEAIERVGQTTVPARYDPEKGEWVPLIEEAAKDIATEKNRSILTGADRRIKETFTKAAPLATLLMQVLILIGGAVTGDWATAFGFSVVNIPFSMIAVTAAYGNDPVTRGETTQATYMYDIGSPFDLEADTLEETELGIEADEISEARQNYIPARTLDLPDELGNTLAAASLNDSEQLLEVVSIELDEGAKDIVATFQTKYGDVTRDIRFDAPESGTLLESPQLIDFAKEAGVPPADINSLENLAIPAHFDTERDEWVIGEIEEPWEPDLENPGEKAIKGPIEAFVDALRNAL